MTKQTVLLVEDEGITAINLERKLIRWGYDIITAASGEEAIEKCMQSKPSLVLMDIYLQDEIDGVMAAEQIKMTVEETPIIYMSAFSDKETLQRAKITNPYGYILKPINDKELHILIEMTLYKNDAEKKLNEYRHTLEEMVEQRTLELQQSNHQLAMEVVERKKAEACLKHLNRQLERAYNETLEGWSRALELRDRETKGHSERVTVLAVRLAQKMGLNNTEQKHLRWGALLHDIGKMGVPDTILLNTGPLTDEEWKIMRQHPVYAHQLLSSITYLQPAMDIPYCHHEKWDGSGYPRGLKGTEIPLAARIFAVVDVWDALRSDRPYHQAWSQAQAVEYIRVQSGKHFDPYVVSQFLQLIETQALQENMHE